MKSWKLRDRVAAIALCESGRLLAALAREIVIFDPDSGEYQPLAAPERNLPENRSNDGKCDPRGRFWFGTMHDSGAQVCGALYCVEQDGSYRQMETGLGIPNGISWSLDGCTMYLADSFFKSIYAYDFDLECSAITNRHVFAKLPDASPAVPDGGTIDAKGFLWYAEWDGWRIVRYSPHGEIDRVIEMPVQRPTSCVFGGPELDKLFITSAIWDMGCDDLESQPHAGGIFVVDVGVRGVVSAKYKR
jgi:sugar lactone lactonase YvrE